MGVILSGAGSNELAQSKDPFFQTSRFASQGIALLNSNLYFESYRERLDAA